MKGLIEGRKVHYVLTKEDADAINRRRVSGYFNAENWPAGAQAHVGSYVEAGEHCSMEVVKVWDQDPNGNGCCNGQVLLDGNDSLWVTSRVYDPLGAPGTWHWIEQA